MKHAYQDLSGHAGTRTLASWMTMLFASVILAACGGGASTTVNQDPTTAACDPNDASTFDECGTVMVALTDANGDFVN